MNKARLSAAGQSRMDQFGIKVLGYITRSDRGTALVTVRTPSISWEQGVPGAGEEKAAVGAAIPAWSHETPQFKFQLCAMIKSSVGSVTLATSSGTKTFRHRP